VKQSELSRRHLLHAAGAVVTTSLAGCPTADDADDTNPTETQTKTPRATDEPTPTESPTSTSEPTSTPKPCGVKDPSVDAVTQRIYFTNWKTSADITFEYYPKAEDGGEPMEEFTVPPNKGETQVLETNLPKQTITLLVSGNSGHSVPEWELDDELEVACLDLHNEQPHSRYREEFHWREAT
jgi:hypothetical protein